MRRVHKESKRDLRRTLNEQNDAGTRITKTLKAVLLQCGGSVTVTLETMCEMEKHYYHLDVEMTIEGLRVALEKVDEDVED